MQRKLTVILSADVAGYSGLLGPRFEEMQIEVLNWVKTDPDLDPVRDHPRFKAMLAAAEARLAQA